MDYAEDTRGEGGPSRPIDNLAKYSTRPVPPDENTTLSRNSISKQTYFNEAKVFIPETESVSYSTMFLYNSNIIYMHKVMCLNV